MAEHDESLLTDFLFGRLDDSSRQTVERDALISEDCFVKLETLERDLIDRYVLGQLSPQDARACEKRLLSRSTGRALLGFSSALHERADRDASPSLLALEPLRPAEPQEPARRRGLPTRWVAIAASLLVVIGAGFAANRLWQVPAGKGLITLEANLLPGIVRSETPGIALELPADPSQIRFHLAVPLQIRDKSRVRLEVRGPETSLDFEGLVVEHRRLALTVKSESLGPAGEYLVRLFPQEGSTGDVALPLLPETVYRFVVDRP